MDVRQIDDAKYYQEFFGKVDKGIFIQKEKLERCARRPCACTGVSTPAIEEAGLTCRRSP